jgi:hypothetical protein
MNVRKNEHFNRRKKNNFHFFFLSYIALKKCTNLQDLWHPLKSYQKSTFVNAQNYQNQGGVIPREYELVCSVPIWVH